MAIGLKTLRGVRINMIFYQHSWNSRLTFLGTWILLIHGVFASNLELPLYTSSQFSTRTLALIDQKAHSKTEDVKPLPGITNDNYLFTFQNGSALVVKIFNPKVTDFTERKNERDNQILAWKIGLAPKIELCDERMAFIEYIHSAEEVKINEDTISRCAKLIAKLHSSNLPFKGRFNFVNTAERYLNICITEKNISKQEESFISVALCKFKTLAKKLPAPFLSPCHNDLHRSNFLAAQGDMKLIDWEDSSMGDPAWDISYFLVACRVPEKLWPTFFETYISCIAKKDPTLVKRATLYRPFVLIKIALFLKAGIEFNKQQTDPIKNLINLCMESAEKIFYSEGYQAFLTTNLEQQKGPKQ